MTSQLKRWLRCDVIKKPFDECASSCYISLPCAHRSADLISVNEEDSCSFDNTKPNIRIYCHKRKVISIDAALNPNDYNPFILPIDEQTYSVALNENISQNIN